MNTREYITESLQSLANQFKNLTIRYGYNCLIDLHVVVLTPLEVYENNPTLDKAWMDIALEVMEKYGEEIAFISNDSTLSKFVPELEFKASSSSNDLAQILYSELIMERINYSFPTHLVLKGKREISAYSYFVRPTFENLQNNDHSPLGEHDEYAIAA